MILNFTILASDLPATPNSHPETQLIFKCVYSCCSAFICLLFDSISLIYFNLCLLGAQGLGFSVTTRGFLDDGYCPIYVKSIFSEGAAVEDGRLKPGDVLLEVFFSSAFHFNET